MVFKAGLAQLVEQLICNQQVVGSIPIAGSTIPKKIFPIGKNGGVPERPKGAGCKPAGLRLHRFESYPLHQCFAGVAQLARALAFQAKGRGFESRLPLHFPF
jgi:hypothetical protein